MTLNFLLNDESVAIVTWVGTILTLGGLVYTIMVAKGAKDAAESAVRLLQGKNTLATVAFSYGQINLVKSLIQGNNISGAVIVFDPLKRSIYEILSFMKDRSEISEEVSIVKSNLKTIEVQFDSHNSQGTIRNPRKLQEALTGLGNFLIAREQEIKSGLGKVN